MIACMNQEATVFHDSNHVLSSLLKIMSVFLVLLEQYHNSIGALSYWSMPEDMCDRNGE